MKQLPGEGSTLEINIQKWKHIETHMRTMNVFALIPGIKSYKFPLDMYSVERRGTEEVQLKNETPRTKWNRSGR